MGEREGESEGGERTILQSNFCFKHEFMNSKAEIKSKSKLHFRQSTAHCSSKPSTSSHSKNPISLHLNEVI